MNLRFEHDVSLARLNTFGVEARAAHFVRVETIDQLQALRLRPEWTQGRRLVLGGGSNLLLTRDFDGLVVLIALKGRAPESENASGSIVRAAAGEGWDEFVRWTLASGWSGLENLALIPGTVGASPIQNIGAYGVELKDRFHRLEGVDLETGRVVAMSPAQCGFGYRDSVFKRELRDRFVITSVSFRLPKPWQPVLDYGDIRAELAKRGVSSPTPTEVADVISGIRRAKLPDPAVIGNAGSFFKNPVVSAEQHEKLTASDPRLVSFQGLNKTSSELPGCHIRSAGVPEGYHMYMDCPEPRWTLSVFDAPIT